MDDLISRKALLAEYDRVHIGEPGKARKLIEDAPRADAVKWISVKDRLPENDYGKHWKERPHYLVCLANGLMMVATFGFKEYEWWIDAHSCVLSKEHYREVTHWQPLPEPPKGE